jgi:hypothetical protein
MIPKESFLRNIPGSLRIEQRLPLEAISYCISAIYVSYARLRAIIEDVGVDDPKSAMDITYEQRMDLFATAWSIIDQSHMLISLLRTLPLKKGDELEAFTEKYRDVTYIRNGMDHIHSNLKNLAALREVRPPLFGCLSYCVLIPHIQPDGSKSYEPIEKFNVVTITAGSFTHENHRSPMLNPIGKRIDGPFGAFEFAAFSFIVNLSYLVFDLGGIVKVFDTCIRDQFVKSAEEAAAAAGQSVDDLLKPNGGLAGCGKS